MEPVAGTDARTGQRRSFTQEFDLQQRRLAAAEIGMNELKRGAGEVCAPSLLCFCAGERGRGGTLKIGGLMCVTTYMVRTQ